MASKSGATCASVVRVGEPSRLPSKLVITPLQVLRPSGTSCGGHVPHSSRFHSPEGEPGAATYILTKRQPVLASCSMAVKYICLCTGEALSYQSSCKQLEAAVQPLLERGTCEQCSQTCLPKVSCCHTVRAFACSPAKDRGFLA